MGKPGTRASAVLTSAAHIHKLEKISVSPQDNIQISEAFHIKKEKEKTQNTFRNLRTRTTYMNSAKCSKDLCRILSVYIC